MLYILAFLALVAALIVDAAFHRGPHVVYSDADHRTLRSARVLRAPRLGLVAKPDYIFREDGELVVEEVKSASVRGAPYFHHLMQLGVEMLVVEEAFRRRPVCGRLRYRNRTITIANTEDLQQQVLFTLRRYRAVMAGLEPAAATPDIAKCSRCPVRSICSAGSPYGVPGGDYPAD